MREVSAIGIGFVITGLEPPETALRGLFKGGVRRECLVQRTTMRLQRHGVLGAGESLSFCRFRMRVTNQKGRQSWRVKF